MKMVSSRLIEALDYCVERKENVVYNEKLGRYFIFVSDYDQRTDIEVGKVLGEIEKNGKVFFKFNHLRDDRELYQTVFNRMNCAVIYNSYGEDLSKREVGEITSILHGKFESQKKTLALLDLMGEY